MGAKHGSPRATGPNGPESRAEAVVVSSAGKPEDSASRLSKTNRTTAENEGWEPSDRRSRKQPLTERDGVTLRDEVRDLLDLQGDRPVDWNRAISRFRSYIEDKEDVKAVFESEDGQTARGSDPHRFHPDYAAKQYAKLKDLERGVSEEFGKRLHTAMLTFTASSRPNGQPIPPVDHLDELLASWDALTTALDRVLGDRRYARLGILEPHPGDGVNNGYLHIHVAVFIDGKVEQEDFAPVIRSHVNNCEYATEDAHDPTSEDTISIRHAGLDRDPKRDHAQFEGIEYDSDVIGELAIYLAEYLGTFGDDDPLEEPEHVQASNTLLWVTNRQRWRPCQTAQQYMKYEPPESDSEWRLIGVEKEGDLYPCDNSGGGVETFTTSSDPPPD
uniref:Putative replication protein n=1 Tax=Natrinema sp. CX2021 TaxID=290611 RepID=Q53C61_9EURY|nr:replication protein [Natrinema sp. CX2021]AAU01008.1 putative replication protein [Natrinema sp. CX2021]